MYKAMIVDDEPFILEGLKNVIKWDEHGIEVIATAPNGLIALEILGQIKIDILLTDIKMPEMSGLALIKKAQQTSPDTKYIILSGYDDFKYVQEAVTLGIENYLLKPINEEELSKTLLNTIDKIESDLNKEMKFRNDSNILKENILYRWVLGKINKSELMDRASLISINLSYKNFLVCSMRLINSNSIENDGEMRLAVLNICNELIFPYNESVVFNDFDGDFIFLFFGNSIDSEKHKIYTLLDACIKNTSSYTKQQVFITLGSVEEDYLSLNKSYIISKNLMEYSLILKSNTYIDYTQAKRLAVEMQKVIKVDFAYFKKLISARKLEEAMIFIDTLYTNILNLQGVTPAYVQNISTELLYHALSAAASLKIDTPSIFQYSDNIFAIIFKMKSLEELSEWMKEIVGKIIHYYEKEDENSNPLIKRILMYIETNFADDLSLKSMAVTFHINAAYLGQLFKGETGELFSNYLNKVRIEKAKQLILKTNLNANEIGLKVGYLNANYFYSTFKKFTGEYPTKYKRDSEAVT